ncbi:MAG: glycosyltransferase family 4 protein [Patescibacteria group bacterium]|nr:glycosyltransferase family 4 protein [Patescibacteria group bacterium]
MKKIGIDARLYSQTGVGIYLKNLLFYLDRNNLNNNIFYIYFLKKDFNKINFKNKNIIKKIADFRWHTFSEQILFLINLLKDNLDLIHFTYFTFPIFYFKKYILTVHDLTPIYFKTGKASTKNSLIYYLKYFIFKILFFVSVLKAKQIITPTNTVKKQLIKYFYFLKIENKIKVIYEGLDFEFLKKKFHNYNFSKKFKKFFLYIGNFYPHKNIEKLIYAFQKIKQNYQLILIGPDDYFSKRIEKLISNLSNKNIILIKNLSRDKINWFYKNCLALIHPSLSEGFGLTLVEAAYFKKSIIASNIDVFKEIWGNNYLFFNPEDINDIKNKIEFFIEKKPKFDYSKILKKLSFEKMTKETMNLYLKNLD